MITEHHMPDKPTDPADSRADVRAWEILRNNDLRLVKDVKLKGFANALTQLVQETTLLALSVEPRGKRASKIEQLGKAYKTYTRLAQELRGEGFYPPMPPLSLRTDIERWIVDTRCLIDNPGEDHSRRGPLYHFYPRITGLFFAAFDEEPTSWCGDDGKASRLVEFAYHSMSFARETVDLKTLTGEARRIPGALDTLWYQRSTAALHEQLKKVLQPIADPKTAYAEIPVPDWVVYYGFFHDLLRN